MDDNESLTHREWECRYHIVFIPKCRRRAVPTVAQDLGEVFRPLAQRRKPDSGRALGRGPHAQVDFDPRPSTPWPR